MRVIFWIIQTLFLRSWLIIAGVALGLLARSLFPTAEINGLRNPVDPRAKSYYDQILREMGEDSPLD